ncbi:MAG: hypothetical protein LBD48_09170 [Treponema sp.]|jgi:hypothetical protein|nr:hypothetical protein [Treponema sp.]
MKNKRLILLLLMSAAGAVYAQDETTRLLNLLDNVLNTAADIGRASLSADLSNPDNPSFNILNKTGFTVKSISISRADNGSEGVITLNVVLFNGESARVTLNAPLSRVNRYDIRLVDEDGSRYSKSNVEITPSGVIEVRINDFDE